MDTASAVLAEYEMFNIYRAQAPPGIPANGCSDGEIGGIRIPDLLPVNLMIS
jgi:hypothetical protein